MPDAEADSRFKHNALVIGEPYIRFYAGAPLEYVHPKTKSTINLGTLCIIDTSPRTLTDEQRNLLKTLSRLAVTEIQLREKMQKEQKQAIDQQAFTLAKDLNTSYISQVAHDLRTPLNSFSLGLHELLESELSEKQRAVVGTIELSAELMQLTCSKVLDFNALEHGRALTTDLKTFDVADVLQKSQKIIAGYTHSCKDVDYHWVIDAGIKDTTVVSDRSFVWQMLMNLLSNARKFTTQGYIRTSVSISEEKMLRFEVADTGTGVRQDQVHLLFQPFGQLQQFSGGTGLGLYSVRAKAERLRGKVGFSQNSPKGSVFWFEIPHVAGPASYCSPPDAAGVSPPLVPILSSAEDLALRKALTNSGTHTASYSAGQKVNNRSFSNLWDASNELSRDDKHKSAKEQTQGEASRCGSASEKDSSRCAVLVIDDDVPTRLLLVHGVSIFTAMNFDCTEWHFSRCSTSATAQ